MEPIEHGSDLVGDEDVGDASMMKHRLCLCELLAAHANALHSCAHIIAA